MNNPPAIFTQYVDAHGPVPGWLLFSWVAGSSTIPKPLYADEALTTPLLNPLQADSNGVLPEYFLAGGDYRFEGHYATNGSLVPAGLLFTRDYVSSGGGGSATGDHKVMVSGSDTVPNYLWAKLTDTPSVSWDVNNPGADESLSATVNFGAWSDAYKVKTMGSDPAGYLKDKIASSAQITKLTDIDGVISFELGANASATPTGLAGGDLTGTYPDPLVKELSGLGVSWDSINAQWTTGGTFTPVSGILSVSYKSIRGYGIMVNNAGNLYITKDGGLTWQASSYSATGGGHSRDIEYGKVNTINNGFAIITDNGVKFFEDIPANYDADGIPLQAAWQTGATVHYGAGADIAYNVVAGYWLMAEQNVGVTYIQYLSAGVMPTSKVVPQGSSGSVGGVFYESNTARLVYFERGTGRVWWAPATGFSAATDWTEIKHGTTPILKYIYPAMSDLDGVGSGSSMASMSVFAGNVAISTTNVSDPDAYMLSFDHGTLPALWNITNDGAYWYGTTLGGTAPVLYSLFLGSIPAHRQLVAEHGIVIVGAGVVQDLPNAPFLGTDPWGTIIARAAPVVGGGYTSTMYIANAIQTLAPNLISRSELIVLFVPIVDTVVVANVSKFGTFLAQGGTGQLRYTLRDETYRRIGYSATISGPTPVFTELTCTDLFDPVTQTAITSYTLLAGGRYYLGVLWDANGIQIVGDDAVQTVNTNPLPAFKIDNLASMTPLAVLSSGSESKMRPFLRIKGA